MRSGNDQNQTSGIPAPDLEFALQAERPALFFGHDLDTAALQHEMETICGRGAVVWCDCRGEVPADLSQRFLEGLSSRRTLYVSVDKQLPGAVRDLLLSVTGRGVVLGHEGQTISRRIVVSANVRQLRDLGEDLRDFFPVCVGV